MMDELTPTQAFKSNEQLLEEARAELERMRAALLSLAKYFTSANCIPVDVAVIKAADFWKITGMDATKHTKPKEQA